MRFSTLSRKRKAIKRALQNTPAVASYAEFIASKTIPIWHRFNEAAASGVAANSGSAGASFNIDASPASFLQGATGILGAQEAIQTTIVQSDYLFSAAGVSQRFTQFSWARLLYLPSGGSASTSGFGGSNGSIEATMGSTGETGLTVFLDNGNFIILSSVSTLPRNEYFWLFMRLAGTSASIKWTHNNALVTTAYSTNTNTLTGSGGVDLEYAYLQQEVVGAKIDESILSSDLWSDEDCLLLAQLTGVVV